MVNHTVIGLGSNINPKKNIAQARKILTQRFNLLKASPFIKTKPVGNSDQPDFVNGVMLIETDFTLNRLKSELRKIEKILGRQRSQFKYAPRTIDLDILVWNRKIIDSDVYHRKFLQTAISKVLPNFKF